MAARLNSWAARVIAEVIIRSFFGFRPDLPGDQLPLLNPKTPRGFNGDQRRFYHGVLYNHQ